MRRTLQHIAFDFIPTFLIVFLSVGNHFVLFSQKKEAKSDTGVYVIKPVSFNSSNADFSPVYYKNGLVFTSTRINTLGVKYTSGDGAPLTDLYFVESLPNERWKAAKSLGSVINSKFNDGPCTFNSEGTEIYFNRNYEEKEFQSKLKIMKAEWVDGGWQISNDLPFNNPNYNFAHPALSPSGTALYFSSDMPGGFGGMDLYVSHFKDSIWSHPVNLGNKINTAGNELFPFADSSRLYFSSDGHNGSGGLDIFYTEKREHQWNTPQNLGTPFNSSHDDFGFVRKAGGREGFFSSNRGRYGNDQIYSFKVNQPQFVNCSILKENNYCVTLYEESTFINDTLPYRYEWEIEGKTIPGKKIKYCFNGPGDWEVRLNIIDTLINDAVHEHVTYTVEIRNDEQVVIDLPDTAFTGQLLKFSGLKTNLPDCNVEKYFWDYGDGHYQNGGETTHIYNEPGVYEVRLGVSSAERKGDSSGVICDKCVVKTITVIERRQNE